MTQKNTATFVAQNWMKRIFLFIYAKSVKVWSYKLKFVSIKNKKNGLDFFIFLM